MKKSLTINSSMSFLKKCFLASLLINHSLNAASSNVSSVWTLNEEKNLGDLLKDEVRVDIVFSQWIVGQTKPCGCSLASHGGFEARERDLRSIRVVYPNSIVLDLGNALFPDERELREKAKEQAELKNKKPIGEAQRVLSLNQNAKAIVDEYKKWKLDAFVLSDLERRADNFEEVKKLLGKKDSSLKVLSLDDRAKDFSQNYFDKVVGNTGVRIIALGDADIKKANLSLVSPLLHKEFLNVFVGDASLKSIELLDKFLPAKGSWIYLGSSPDYAMYNPVKKGKILQQIGAYRGQNWMISTLFLNPLTKSFKYKSNYWFTFVDKKEPNKKRAQ